MKAKCTKKYLAIAAMTLACSLFSACSTSENIAFYPFWKENVSATQYTLKEELTYNVAFTPDQNSDKNYTLNYKDGSYTTSLELKSEDGTNFYYVYRTELNITAVFTYNGQSKDCVDQIVSEVVFKDDSTLHPDYSVKTIKNSSPRNGNVSSIEECYTLYEYEIRTDYNDNCTKGDCTVTAKNAEGSKKSFSIDKSKYNYLDNEQLLFALRGIDPAVNSSANLQVYAPFSGTMQSINVQFSNVQGTDFNFTLNGTEKEHTVQYYPVSMKLNGDYPGSTQTVWVASHLKNPSFRNVILKLETPLSYNLGTLTYTLASASFSKQ